jgi:hypothetical protein
MNGPNKLACQITQGWKGLPVTSTLACWVKSEVTKKKNTYNSLFFHDLG